MNVRKIFDWTVTSVSEPLLDKDGWSFVVTIDYKWHGKKDVHFLTKSMIFPIDVYYFARASAYKFYVKMQEKMENQH